jgi:hypothetical protein
LQARAKKIREEHKQATQKTINTAVAAGSAFAVGYAEAAYPDSFGKGVMGVDTSLLIGLVGVAAPMVGLVNDEMTADVVEAIGLGALASYAAKKGRETAAK